MQVRVHNFVLAGLNFTMIVLSQLCAWGWSPTCKKILVLNCEPASPAFGDAYEMFLVYY